MAIKDDEFNAAQSSYRLVNTIYNGERMKHQDTTQVLKDIAGLRECLNELEARILSEGVIYASY